MADGAVRVFVDTQELSSEDMKTIFDLYGKYGFFVFAEDAKTQLRTEFENLPKVKLKDKDNSPSKRLRSVLFVLFKQEGITGDFEEFYRLEIEKFILQIKEKLEPITW